MDQRDANIQVCRDMYQAVFAGDKARLRELVDPKVAIHEADSLPYGGVYHGLDGMDKIFNLVFKDTWEEVKFEPEEFTAGGELVIAYFHMTAKGKKTGKTFSFPGCEVMRVRGGKIVEIKVVYWDTKLAAEVYG